MPEVLKILTEQLNTQAVPRTRPSDEFYVSGASCEMKNVFGELVNEGACRRQTYYRMTGQKPDKEDVYTRQAAYGDVVSDFEADLAKKAGIYLAHEHSIFMEKEGVRIKGRSDLLVEVPLESGNKERIGVEFKSVGSYHSKKGTILTPRGVKFFPKIAHALQSAVYLDHYKQFGFTHWQIIYIDRAMGDVATHIVQLTEEGDISVNSELIGVNVKDIYKRWAEVWEYIQKGEVPDRDYELKYSQDKLRKMSRRGELSKTDLGLFSKGKLEKGDWQCNYCEFAKTCWKKKAKS